MKIAIASCGLGHVTRGIEAWAVDLARALVERGRNVTLYKGAGRAETCYERILPCWQRAAVRTQRLLYWLPQRIIWRLGLGSAYGVEQVTFALGLIRALRQEPADILHVQDPYVALILQRAGRAGLVAARTILAHGTEEPLPFQHKITFLQHLAPWHLEQARRAGIWKSTWTAIPNFIDTDQFCPGPSPALRAELGIPADGLVVLTSAAIKREHKRIDYLLEETACLLAQQPHRPLWLVIAGSRESDTDELMALGQARLGNRVRFLVQFPRPRMPELYRLADLFVLCSLKEMMPIALLEALASGVPCLVHRHPVLEWMIGPGGAAIDMAAEGALAAALKDWLIAAPRRREQGAQGRQHCLVQFSRQQVLDQILQYYRFVRSRPESLLREEAQLPCPANAGLPPLVREGRSEIHSPCGSFRGR